MEGTDSLFRIIAKPEGFDDARAQIKTVKAEAKDIKVRLQTEGFTAGRAKLLQDTAVAITALHKAVGTGGPIEMGVKFTWVGLTAGRLALLKELGPIFKELRKAGAGNLNVSIKFDAKGLTAGRIALVAELIPVLELLDKAKSGPRNFVVNLNLQGLTPGRIANLAALIPTIEKLQMVLGGKPININISVTGAAKAAQALGAVATQTRTWRAQVPRELEAVQNAYARTFQRIHFLTTAFIAQFAYEVIGHAAQDAMAVDGALRGMQISYTRAGLSGREYMGVLREIQDEHDHFRFKIGESTDGLNKLVVGGLRPTIDQLKQMKAMSVGAGHLFGESPTKMFEDLSTAALRVSYRMADNLGLVIRPMETYAAKARELKKDVKELTGLEKSQAFFQAMLATPGASMLMEASKLDTPALAMERSKVVIDDFKLSLGRAIAEGIMPFIGAIDGVNTKELDTIARTTILIAKVALLTTGLRAGAAAAAYGATKLEALLLAQQMYNTGVRAGAYSDVATRQMVGGATPRAGLAPSTKSIIGGAAAIAAITLATMAYEQHNRELAKLAQLQLDVLSSGTQFLQYLASINLASVDAAKKQRELNAAIAASGTTGPGRDQLDKTIGSTKSFGDELARMIDEMQLSEAQSSTLKTSISDLTEQGINKFIKAVTDAEKANGDLNLSQQAVAEIASTTLVPAMRDAYGVVLQGIDAQTAALLETNGVWETTFRFITIGINAVGEVLGRFVMSIVPTFKIVGEGLKIAFYGAFNAIVTALPTFLNSVIDKINPFLQGINAGIAVVPALGWAQLPTLPHVPVSKGLKWDANKSANNIELQMNELGAMWSGGWDMAHLSGLDTQLDELSAKRKEVEARINQPLAYRPDPKVEDPEKKKKKTPKKKGGTGLDSEQTRNANTIIKTGRAMGATDPQILSALEVAMQESSLRNINYGDKAGPDSRGLFQQRNSWGPLSVRMNPESAARLYYQHVMSGKGTGNEGNFDPLNTAPALMGQKVQHGPRAKDYAKHSKLANQLLYGSEAGETRDPYIQALEESAKNRDQILDALLKKEQELHKFDDDMKTRGITDPGKRADLVKGVGEAKLDVIWGAQHGMQFTPGQVAAAKDYSHYLDVGVQEERKATAVKTVDELKKQLSAIEQTNKFYTDHGIKLTEEERLKTQQLLGEKGMAMTARELLDIYRVDKDLAMRISQERTKLLEATAKQRALAEHAADFDWQTNRFKFASQVAQAFDPKQSPVIGYNSTLQQMDSLKGFIQTAQQSGELKAGSPEARQYAEQLKSLYLEAINQGMSIRDSGKYRNPDVDASLNNLRAQFPEIQALTDVIDPLPSSLNTVAGAADNLGTSLGGLNTTVGEVMGGMAAAYNAMINSIATGKLGTPEYIEKEQAKLQKARLKAAGKSAGGGGFRFSPKFRPFAGQGKGASAALMALKSTTST